MPEYSLDTNLNISCGLFSFIAFVIVMIGLYNLQVQFSVKVGLFLAGAIILKLFSQQQEQREARDR